MTPEQIAEAQQLAREFVPRKENSNSNNSISSENPIASGTGFFITDDGYLISNDHVVKGAAKVRLLTSAGLIDAKVVQVDAANDLALLKADGRFAPLPIAASRTVNLGGTVATVGFPDIGLQGFAPKLAGFNAKAQRSKAATKPMTTFCCICNKRLHIAWRSDSWPSRGGKMRNKKSSRRTMILTDSSAKARSRKANTVYSLRPGTFASLR